MSTLSACLSEYECLGLGYLIMVYLVWQLSIAITLPVDTISHTSTCLIIVQWCLPLPLHRQPCAFISCVFELACVTTANSNHITCELLDTISQTTCLIIVQWCLLLRRQSCAFMCIMTLVLLFCNAKTYNVRIRESFTSAWWDSYILE